MKNRRRRLRRTPDTDDDMCTRGVACVYDVSNTSQYMQNICLQLVTRKREKTKIASLVYNNGTYVENSFVCATTVGLRSVRGKNSFDSIFFFICFFIWNVYRSIALRPVLP